MKERENFFMNFLQVSDTDTMYLSAAEFIDFVQTKRHLIKQSRYIPAPFGFEEFGKFKVVIDDGKHNVNWPNK